MLLKNNFYNKIWNKIALIEMSKNVIKHIWKRIDNCEYYCNDIKLIVCAPKGFNLDKYRIFTKGCKVSAPKYYCIAIHFLFLLFLPF